MTRWLVRLLGLPGIVVAATGVAAAHEVTGRLQAPMPLGLVFAGGALAVAATAVILAASDAALSDRTWTIGRLPERAVRWGCLLVRVVFLGAFALAVALGITGSANPVENFATVFVWGVWLKGVAILAALVGNPWGVLSPWRTVYDALAALEGREISLLGSYPERLGEWPALAGYVLWLGIGATVTDLPQSPQLTAVLVAQYAGITLLGGVAFGRAWFERADALAVFYGLFGRVSPIRFEPREDGYDIRVRPPWRGCTDPVGSTATAAFVIATVYTVSFDGFRSAPEYREIAFGLRDVLDVGSIVDPLLYLFGLASFVVFFALVVRLSERAAGSAGTGTISTSCPGLRAFAATVLPIAIAYEIAHFYPFVIRRTIRAAWLLVGGAPPPDPLWFLSLAAFWTTQAVLIVGGHVVAVVAAHAVARDRYPTAEAAARGHLPLTALMVGYTILSLWIVSRPFVPA